jgi:hypothetical protein
MVSQGHPVHYTLACDAVQETKQPTAYELWIRHTWDGQPIPPHEQARVAFSCVGKHLVVEVQAPFHGDAPPSAAPGRCDRLWEHEVVELFLLGSAERYLELELGPHGHYLALSLAGRRRVADADLAIAFESVRQGSSWHGRALVPARYLPADVERGNAYAIHGQGAARRYLACFLVPGPEPDFHRLEHFGRVAVA